MAQPTMIKKVETDDPVSDHLKEHDEAADRAAGHLMVFEPASPAQIRTHLGYLLVPSHIPSGFVLVQSGLLLRRQAVLRYLWDETVLIIREDTQGGRLYVKTGSTEDVTLGGFPGYLVRGTWVSARSARTQTVTPPQWIPGEMLALILEMDNMWVKIAVSPVDQGVDEAELFRIAESLVDYQG